MNEILDPKQRALRTLIAAPVAWQGPAELAEALGWTLEATNDLLADLHVEGWVDIWKRENQLSVTLSTLGAERLGVRLVEYGPAQSLRWWPIGDPDPPAPRARNVCSQVESAALEFVLDPHAGPDEEVLAWEEPPTETQRETWSRPSLLIGVGLTPWPGPGTNVGESCPACRQQDLAPHMYCLYCDRWGLDATLTRMEDSVPEHQPMRPPSLAAARRAEARHESARSRRKARRKVRLASRVTRDGLERRRASETSPVPGSDARWSISQTSPRTPPCHHLESASDRPPVVESRTSQINPGT
jgi:hypothetical protein